MHYFDYQNGVLCAEDVSLARIAAEAGTPFYCYSAATLRRHYRVFSEAFEWNKSLVAFSVKSCSNVAVAALLAREGAGADVVSGGELYRALKAGVPGERIVFSGVGKTREEMAAALDAGIYQFNVESEPELEALSEVAVSKGAQAPVAIRINPDVAAGGHENISTGKAEDKFGVAWERVRETYARADALPGVAIKGVDVHIGSQIADLTPMTKAFRRVAEMIGVLRADGIAIERLDLGGGLGIPYGEENPGAGAEPPLPSEYSSMVREITEPLGVRLVFEPGRLIAGNAGVMVARVVYVKEGLARRFLILDAAMNDLMRPALYDAYHAIWPVRQATAGEDRLPFDVVGPVCESTDRFAKARALPPQGEGDLVAFLSAGAYGAVMASEYNTRPLIPEVLVDGDRYAIVRRRPSYEEMLEREEIPDWI